MQPCVNRFCDFHDRIGRQFPSMVGEGAEEVGCGDEIVIAGEPQAVVRLPRGLLARVDRIGEVCCCHGFILRCSL